MANQFSPEAIPTDALKVLQEVESRFDANFPFIEILAYIASLERNARGLPGTTDDDVDDVFNASISYIRRSFLKAYRQNPEKMDNWGQSILSDITFEKIF